MSILLPAVLWASPPQAARGADTADPERRLEQAIHNEIVLGDPAGAVEQYRAILAQTSANRSVSARALFQMAQCLERLGRRKEARAAYTRALSEFADQADIAAKARVKLSGWTDAMPGPRNLKFEEGEPGQIPPGWFVPSVEKSAASLAEVRRKGCRGASCAVVVAPPFAPKPVGSLMQSFSAAAYRGKTLRLRAWLRLEAARTEDRAQLWFSVDGPNGATSFFDNMDDRPVRSADWTRCEIAAYIDEDAQFLEFGVMSVGLGRVWVDEVSLDVVPRTEVTAARDAVQTLYQQPDGPALLPGAKYLSGVRSRDLREALSDRFTPLQTSLLSFRLSGSGATATVRCEFNRAYPQGTFPGVHTYRDTWSRTPEGWRLKERVLLTGHISLPATDEDIAAHVVADLKQYAAPLATPQAGHTYYDLAPFGSGVGDSRVVVLGEAAGGVREFIQLKHRLIEYLVKEKGFTALALDGVPGAAVLDRYAQTGEGDPRPALDSQEVLDVIEWMRAYNQSPVAHATLRIVTAPADQKTVVWTNNRKAATLREQFGARAFVVGLFLHHGELRAMGIQNGAPTGVAPQTVPPPPEGSGDAVLGEAGMPLFFLDLRVVPPTPLGDWLREPHLFLCAGQSWNRDDALHPLRPAIPAKQYDGLIFLQQVHAAKGLEVTHANY